MSNRDDFWTTLATGHTNTLLAHGMDRHLGVPFGEAFEGVRVLSDVGRAAHALSLPVAAGVRVSFAGTLGAHMAHDDVPGDGAIGEVVTVKSATGEITHHDGKVFVKWGDGKFRPIHAVHLRLADPTGKTADESQDKEVAELLEAKPDNSFLQSVEEQLEEDRSLSDKQEEVLDEIREEVKSDKAASFRVGTLGDLTNFLKIAEGKLIHTSTADLWSYSKDADGAFLVSRLFDDVGEPLKG